MNKRGWIKIVEAFISILIVISVVLIVNNNQTKNEDLSSKIYPIQILVLREIELDNNLREKILAIPEDQLPLEQEKFQEKGLGSILIKINERIPSNWMCVPKICSLDGNICELKEYLERDIYAKSVSIVADSSTYSPKQVKLFCYIQ